MKDLNNYILEKLKINDDSSLKYGFQKGDPITYIWVEDMEDEDTGEVMAIFRIYAGAFKVEKFENNTLYYKNGNYDDIDRMDAYINSNGLLQRKSTMGIFLSLQDTKIFCNRILKEKDFLENGIFNFFEANKGAFDNIHYDDSWFKKTLRSINATISKLHSRKT